MDEVLKMFGKALRHLENGNLPFALGLLSGYAKKNPFVLYSEELQGVDESLRLMLHYMEQGASDPEREKLYGEMLKKTKRIARNMLAEYRRRNVDFYSSANSNVTKDALGSEKAVRMQLESFVADIAMLSLEPDDKRKEIQKTIYSRHFNYMQSLFCGIVVSDMWTPQQAEAMTEIMLLPTVDIADAQLLISAVMLAVMNNFDINKFKTLVDVYRGSHDERVRQKALVGWAMAVTDRTETEEQRKIVDEVCKDPVAVKELLELQKQVFFCMNTEEDNKIIQRDIIPTLMENSNLEISRLGISEKDADPMQDILDPGAEDKAMEKVEEKFQQMKDMQKSGADVYFGGFSQMKRFSFFYSLVNWFVPFNINHPSLRLRQDNGELVGFLSKVLANDWLCDSDKYSFALMFSSIFDKLPANIKDMIGMADRGGMPGQDSQSAAYVRRQALQDLYRFFRLYDKHSQIYDPFSKKNFLFLANEAFNHSLFQRGILDLGCSMMARKSEALLERVVALTDAKANADTQEGRDALLFSAAYHMKYVRDYELVGNLLAQVLDKEPDNAKALAMYARAMSMCGNDESAKGAYEKLFALEKPKDRWLLNYAVVLTNMMELEKAAGILFQLDFEHPGTPNVGRALAWNLLWQKKVEQAAKEYKVLVERKDATARDFMNAGYCHWFVGDMPSAIGCFVRYIHARLQGEECSADSSKQDIIDMLDEEFSKDDRLLSHYGVSELDKMLVGFIVSDRCYGNK